MKLAALGLSAVLFLIPAPGYWAAAAVILDGPQQAAEAFTFPDFPKSAAASFDWSPWAEAFSGVDANVAQVLGISAQAAQSIAVAHPSAATLKVREAMAGGLQSLNPQDFARAIQEIKERIRAKKSLNELSESSKRSKTDFLRVYRESSKISEDYAHLVHLRLKRANEAWGQEHLPALAQQRNLLMAIENLYGRTKSSKAALYGIRTQILDVFLQKEIINFKNQPERALEGPQDEVPARLGLTKSSVDNDVTEEFQIAQNDPLAPEELSKLRNDVVVVFVGGFFSQHLANHSEQLRAARQGGADTASWPTYFGETERALSDWGIEYKTPNIHSEQVSENTVPRLLEIIEEAAAAGKRAVFIPHSHGALDVLRTLIHIEETPSKRHLLNSVSWIPIQGPFLGTPGADKVINSYLHHLLDWFLEHTGGSRECMREMTTQASVEYYRKHQGPIEKILKQVATIALASCAEPLIVSDVLPGPRAVVEFLRMFSSPQKHRLATKLIFDSFVITWAGLVGAGIKGDGLVPVDSAFYQGMEHIIIEGMGHFDPLLPNQLRGLLRMELARYERIRAALPPPAGLKF